MCLDSGSKAIIQFDRKLKENSNESKTYMSYSDGWRTSFLPSRFCYFNETKIFEFPARHVFVPTLHFLTQFLVCKANPIPLFANAMICANLSHNFMFLLRRQNNTMTSELCPPGKQKRAAIF